MVMYLLPYHKYVYGCFIELGDNYCIDVPINVNEIEFDSLKKDFDNINFSMVHDANIYLNVGERRTELYQYGYFSEYFKKVYLIDNNEVIFELRQGQYPKSVKEVLISDYMARVIVEFELFEDVNSFEDIIGLVMPVPLDFKIVGIVKTDYEKYNHLIRETSSSVFDEDGFYEYSSMYYRNIYMSKETFEQSVLHFWFNNAIFQYKGKFKITTAEFIPIHTFYEGRLIGDSQLPKEDNEIILPISAVITLFSLPILLDDNVINSYNEILTYLGESFEISIWNSDLGLNVYRNYKIVGIYDDITNEPLRSYRSKNRTEWYKCLENCNSQWAGTKEEIETIQNMMYKANSTIMIQLGDNHNENIELIKTLDYLGYQHQNEYSQLLYKVSEITQGIKTILYFVGLVFCIFTSLLINLFISSNVKINQKSIGTLRALGARGTDVSKIFIIQGIMIAIVTSIMTVSAMKFSISFMNHYISDGFNTSLVLLEVNWINILIVILITILVILISTIIPIKRIIQMKPINAIKDINN